MRCWTASLATASVGVDAMLFNLASPMGDGQVIQLHVRVMDKYCIRAIMIRLVKYLIDEIYGFAFMRRFQHY
ncbi:hypothetical protein FF2_037783 [Malus domestica]